MSVRHGGGNDEEQTGVAVAFDRVSRFFGSVRAVDDVSFEVREGEFFTFLGPSGSGKTTCLRLIAGFEQPDRGTVLLAGRSANRVPPYDRDVHTVFQDYALFPHMSVLDNVGYGLMVKGVARRERHALAADALAMVRLGDLGRRRPGQLSGGQRQRVALARALVGRPRLLLLDEPLGALDLKLREQMQVELKELQAQVGITFVYVTHDQEEALSMSDRIAVFNRGRIEQLASPSEIYERPATGFVAGFVGTSNLLEGAPAEALTGSPLPVLIRPERIRLQRLGAAVPSGEMRLNGRIHDVVYLGMNTRYHIGIEGDLRLTVVVPNAGGGAPPLPAGEAVVLSWSPQHLHRLEG